MLVWMRALLLVGLLAGCDGVFGLQHIYGGPGSNGPVDAPPDMTSVDAPPPGSLCFGTGLGFVPPFCYPAGTVFPSALSTLTIDTTSCTTTRMQPGGPMLCVVTAQNISIGGYLRATGDKPLVLIAASSIDLSGTIDVSSTGGATDVSTGAGANQMCGAGGTGVDGSGGVGGGGGAGGSFVSIGGSGGMGSTGNGGGAAAGTLTPTVIRGGCPGGSGGAGGTTAPAGGAGGGAIYLVAGNAINIHATIRAYGAGGPGGPPSAGGGGGGSGGFVGLDAPIVFLDGGANISAAGGGGGEGGSTAGVGTDGMDGSLGGVSATNPGGDGGSGSGTTGDTGRDGSLASSGAAGGGGGGGGGTVVVFSPNLQHDPSAVIVPALP